MIKCAICGGTPHTTGKDFYPIEPKGVNERKWCCKKCLYKILSREEYQRMCELWHEEWMIRKKLYFTLPENDLDKKYKF